MTPERLQLVAERLREFRPELDDAAIARMLVAAHRGVQWLARQWVSGPRREAVVSPGWVDRDHWESIPDAYFDFAREGRPSSVPWRAVLNEKGQRVDHLVSPAEKPDGASASRPDTDGPNRFDEEGICRVCGGIGDLCLDCAEEEDVGGDYAEPDIVDGAG